MKANYYKLAKVHHPDRVAEADKNEAKERFNIIHNAYSILSNAQTKAIYDADGTDIFLSKLTVAAKWDQYMKIVKTEDIECAKAKYQGSSVEEADILREFIIGKGSVTHLMNVIPFMRYEDENRIIGILKRCMEEGKIEKMVIRKIRH